MTEGPSHILPLVILAPLTATPAVGADTNEETHERLSL